MTRAAVACRSAALGLALLAARPAFTQQTWSRAEVLGRDAAALPSAAPGAWDERWEQPDAWPADLRVSYGAALQAYADEDFVLALHHLNQALERHPGFPPALHQLGVIHFRLRRYGDAVVAFERMLVHAPEHAARTRALGHALYSLGRYDDARAHYERVLTAAPDMVEAIHGLALTEMRAGRPELAAVGLERVLDLDPKHADAAYWHARTAFDESDAAAEDACRELALRAVALSPFDPRPEFLLAEVLYALADEASGEDLAALERDADAARERFLALDRVEREVRPLEARLLFDPALSPTLEQIGALRLEVGDAARARAAWLRLAQWYSARGEGAQAERVRERIAAEVPR